MAHQVNPDAADADNGAAPWTGQLPQVAGSFALDKTSLDGAAHDFGLIARARPAAVLRPASSKDIAETIRFARHHRLTVAARGTAHSAGGQVLVAGGVVVAMRSLARIGAINLAERWIEVEAGALWSEVLAETLVHGLRPPVIPDWLEMTVGGTLSFGGIGAESFRAGTQTDQVLELEVVTGTGETLSCSPARNSALFHAVRAGLGQFGIITRARLALVPAPAQVVLHTVLYTDLFGFLKDLDQLTADPRVDGLRAHFIPNDPQVLGRMFSAERCAGAERSLAAAGRWLPRLEITSYGEPPQTQATAVGPLSCLSDLSQRTVLPYREYASRVPPIMLREQQQGPLPHPEVALFVPGDAAPQFLAQTLAGLDPVDVGGALLLVPLLRAVISTPAFRCPPGERFLLFTVLRCALPASADNCERLIRQNAAIAEQGRRLSATRYAADSLTSLAGAAAWREHFGAAWAELAAAKQRFDPDNLLAPGLQIFPRPALDLQEA